MDEEERQQMLKDLEREASDDLWEFMQTVADDIKHPNEIQTDEQWPTI